jgi:translation initiation factor IF-3
VRSTLIQDNLRVNERIRVSEVRLIDANGEQVGIISRDDALRRAQEAGLDLVEVAPTAKPPVCKLLDWGKFKYQQKKRSHQAEAKRHQTQVKEIRLTPKTEEHDLRIKLEKAREFLQRRDKVFVNMRFRGREMFHVDLGRAMLERISRELEDIAKVEQTSRMEGRRLTMTLSPR